MMMIMVKYDDDNDNDEKWLWWCEKLFRHWPFERIFEMIWGFPNTLRLKVKKTCKFTIIYIGSKAFFKCVMDLIVMLQQNNFHILERTPVSLFRCASISSTYPCQSVCPSVRPLVRNTFKFPLYQCLWLLYVKSWRKRTPIIFQFRVWVSG